MEEWREVIGYEGEYLVSNLGNIRSLKNDIIMKQEIHYKGHMRIDLCSKGIILRYYVHQLVAKAFVPIIDGKGIVNHIDGNKQNNKVENLEWATVKENNYHSRTFLHPRVTAEEF